MGQRKHSVIPDLVDPTSSAVFSSSFENTSLLNRFFADQTRLDTGSSSPDASSLTPNPDSLTTFHTTPSKVFDVLRHLPVNEAGGLDGITPLLIRLCAPGVAVSLAFLFNRSFS